MTKLTTEQVEDAFENGMTTCGCCTYTSEQDKADFREWLADVIKKAKDEAYEDAAHQMGY